MDLDSYFMECCKACQHFKTSIKIQGQGDCKGSIDVQKDQNVWMSADKEDKFRSKVRVKDQSEFKLEKQKYLQETQCDCYRKINKQREFSDKFRQEKKNPDIFQSYNNTWNSAYAIWKNGNDSKMERFYTSKDKDDGSLITEDSNAVKLAETVSELEGKVDFLFQFLRHCGQNFFTEACDEQSQKNNAAFADVFHLFHLSKRVSAAEEGIKKLALILENLLKNSYKEKTLFSDINRVYSEPLNFEEMTIVQRINLLKKRNDLLLSFMKDYLKVGSVEEIHSRLDNRPKDNETRQTSFGPKWCCEENIQSKDLQREEIIDSLKKLRVEVTKAQEKKPKDCIRQCTSRSEKKEENSQKQKNKLEVISEQAELTLNNDNETESVENYNSESGRNLKGKFSEVREKFDGKDLNICDVTTRLLAQEALLKSSLDKVHFEVFSKHGSTEKKFLTGNLNIVNNAKVQKKEGNCDSDTNYDSSGESTCNYESEIAEKFKANGEIPTPGKHLKYNECKGPLKGDRNFSENPPNNICKQNAACSKKSDEQQQQQQQQQEAKNKVCRKVLQKNSYTALATSSKVNQNSCFMPSVCPSSWEENRKEGAGNRRPATAPIPQRKTRSSLKSSDSEKIKKKNSEINNVKSKNKILLSKKTFVRTS